MKDNFSQDSDLYARYRPTYPPDLFGFLFEQVKGKDCAWDCGTGNGQVAAELLNLFSKVYATDISQKQLDNALRNPNIHYSLQPAENSGFSDRMFDLITVAQAVHWFQFEKFYEEVRRTLKDEGMLAIMGYSLFRSNNRTEEIINEFYKNILGSYWDEERKYLDEHYKTIPFPFNELRTPEFSQVYEWDFEHLIGYLRTWSAVKHFLAKEGYDPVDLIYNNLYKSFGSKGKLIFPIHVRVGTK